jgi:ankyrin repeat protein
VAEAIYNRDTKALKRLLLERKVDINQAGKEGFTYLQYATQFGDDQMMEILLENGADPNLISILYRANGRYVGKQEVGKKDH